MEDCLLDSEIMLDTYYSPADLCGVYYTCLLEIARRVIVIQPRAEESVTQILVIDLSLFVVIGKKSPVIAVGLTIRYT